MAATTGRMAEPTKMDVLKKAAKDSALPMIALGAAVGYLKGKSVKASLVGIVTFMAVGTVALYGYRTLRKSA